MARSWCTWVLRLLVALVVASPLPCRGWCGGGNVARPAELSAAGRPARRAVVLAAAKKTNYRVVSVNKQARRNYEFLEELEAGISLVGTEVKAIRDGRIDMTDGFAQVKKGECWLKNVHIGPDKSSGPFFQHEARRERKLLLHKNQIRKFNQEVRMKQLTIVPVKAYFNEDNRLKIQLALARGKNTRDKREDIRRRDASRELKRAIKTANNYR